MITVARLRPHNKKQGHGMKTYTSAAGNKYAVGVGVQPSPIKILNDEKEIAELEQFAQFEIQTFRNREALDTFIENEVAQKVRQGYQVAKPLVEEVKAPKRTASVLDDDDGEKSNANSGRPPQTAKSAVDEEREELVAEIQDMEVKHAEAIELGRTDATIEKWEGRLDDAKVALAEYDEKKAAE